MSTFTGTATLTSTRTGSHSDGFSTSVFFESGLTHVVIPSFPTISSVAGTPIGSDDFTITLAPNVAGNATGTFTPSGSSAGMMTLELALHLHNSVNLGVPGDVDSNMLFTGTHLLTTETARSADGALTLTGSRYNPTTGAITLVGCSQFSGGPLGGTDCSLTLAGTLSSPAAFPLNWALAADTSGFGNLVSAGALFFTGSFAGQSDDVLFYHPSDSNWFVGTFNGTNMNWSLACNTSGFGNLVSAGARFFTGKFDGSNDGILFYHPSDGNWWLGTFNGTSMNWKLACNTNGFGNLISAGALFLTGRFDGSNDGVLFYHPSDSNWFVGTFNGTTMNWSLACNTNGFGNLMSAGARFFTGNFDGSNDGVLFYHPSDGNWFVGTFNGTTMNWSLACNTNGFGNLISAGARFFVGDFNGGATDQVLFYHPSDSNWFLGTFGGTSIGWGLACNTNVFGNVSQCLFFTGNFTGTNADVLFYHPSDNHWFVGVLS